MSLIGAIIFASCSLPSQREMMEAFVLLDNGALFETQFSKSDTGIYKGQGRLNLNRWYKGQTPLSFAFYANDVDTTISLDTTNIGINQLQKLKSGWSLRVKSNDFNATAMLTGSEGPTHEIEGWKTQVMGSNMQLIGWASGAKRSVPIKGHGVLIHQKGPSMPTSNRTLMVASGDGWSVGIDHHPPKQMAWGNWGELDLGDESINIEEIENGLKIHADEWSAIFVAEERLGETDPHEHLFWAERIAAYPWINDNIEARYSGMIIIQAGEQKIRGTAVLRRQEIKPIVTSAKEAQRLSETIEATVSE